MHLNVLAAREGRSVRVLEHTRVRERAASLPKTWNSGETLTAVDLNGNFAAVDGRLTTLENGKAATDAAIAALQAAPTSLEAGSAVGQTGIISVSTVYTKADLVLPAGTWLIVGQAILSESFPDSVALGLYDATTNGIVPGSLGAPTVLSTTNSLAFSTTHVLTLTSTTTIRLVAWQNGASVVSFADTTGTATGNTLPNRLKAWKLR